MDQVPSGLLRESTAHILRGKVDVKQLWTSERAAAVTYPLLRAVAFGCELFSYHRCDLYSARDVLRERVE